MKKTKVIQKVLLVFALCAVVFFAKNEITKAADFNITSPANGSILGAGYNDIKWDSVSGAFNYDVYIGGTKVTTTTDTTYTYYSVRVQAQEVCVVANLTNGYQKASNKVQFGITKKGLGLNMSMGNYLDLKDWKLGWYYNWGETPYDRDNYKGVEYVPMIWKSTTANDTKTRANKAKSSKYKYLLTFNEPDLPGQCNMSVDAVKTAWAGLKGIDGIKISSPVTARWPKASSGWFQPFMNKLTTADRSPDFISIHCYPENYAGAGMANWFVEEVVDWTWNTYHKPIWITEFSTTGNSVSMSATTEFWKAVMPKLDARDYVERYAAFGFNAKDSGTKNVGLWYYSTGMWTDAGAVYKAQGNPDFSKVLLSGVDYSKLNLEPGSSTGGSSVKYPKPGKAKIKSAKYKKSKKISVKLKKISKAKGYNVRWCDNKKFDGFEGKHIKKLSYTIKGLEKNTKYFVKARAYNYDANGAKQYGKWSTIKKVKVKK